MAQIHLQTPDAFNFKEPEEWPRWKRRFEQFRVASGLKGEAAEKQVSTLLYCLGEEAEAVLASTNITDEERKVYDTVLKKFDDFFKVRKNVIFERARFNRRNQLQGETAEQYIMALYALADNCEYGAMKEELIRDKLVVGIQNDAVSKKLQLISDLTLEQAKKEIRQNEAVQEQQRTLKATEGPGVGNGSLEAAAVTDPRHQTNPQRHSNAKQTQQQSNRGRTFPRGRTCTRCGKGQHPKEKCPARNAVCFRCGRTGHYSECCYSKTVSSVSTEYDSTSFMDTAFLDTLSGEQEKAWFTTITVKDVDIRFKLDTGAEVTAITSDAYQLLEKPQLNAADKILCGPSRHPLGVVGKFKCNLATKGKVTRQEIFVVKGLKHNLLGLPAITALNLAARIDCTLSTTNTFKERFPKVFEGLGNLGEEYVIKLKPDAKPHALYAARHVPLPLRPKVTEELNRMETMGIISRVDEPTPWCAGMVVVPKKSGAIRICVDLKPLNESVLREVHPLPIVNDTLSQLKGAKIFTKLDANSGFWQIPLSKPSRLLTTFITPAGRYCFNKLPFGISSAPEHFQKRMGHILQGLDGVLCQTDDVLIFGSNQTEHDTRVTAALERLQSAGVTLNPEKCEFSRRCLKFLGHIIDQNGIRPDPDKTAAIMQMKTPETTTELRRFLGMANQLGKFTPKLAELARPLRELLSKTATWNWGPMQDQAFVRVKEELSKETTLAHYDPAAPTKISADASSYGLGAVLLQQTTSQWKPIAYASRSMSDTERRYAQIEKEALASTWACEKFATYVLGMKFILETDHKPLVPLLNSKYLDSLPPRILRFRLRLSRFDYSVQHVPGKELYTADTLSRSPLPMTGYEVLADLAEAAMDATVTHLPASKQRIDKLQTAQNSDATCTLVMQYCREGWPTKHEVSAPIRPYWEARGELTLSRNNLLLYNSRIVIPASMQQTTLTKLHHGHQGIDRCRQRAKISVWWPGISRQVEDFVQKCEYCAKHAVPRKEPLIPSTLPDYPWQKVGTDLFVLGKDTYIITVDYFSRYPEIVKLTSTTSQCIIAALKGIFARHGIPETVVSDNGPQYSSQEFTEFAKAYSFHHVTSSPHFPQSNGQVERTVKTVKKLLSGSNDPCLSLLAYRTTPLPWCNLSPAQLLMGRQIRSELPQVRDKLTPQWPYLNDFRVREKEFKGKQKHDFDRRHRVKELPCLPDNTEVVVTTGGQLTPGHIVEPADTPRSHMVQTSSGVIRRNRSQLNAVPNPNSQENVTPPDTQARSLPNPSQTQTRSPIRTRSRTGTPVTAPDRFSSS